MAHSLGEQKRMALLSEFYVPAISTRIRQNAIKAMKKQSNLILRGALTYFVTSQLLVAVSSAEWRSDRLAQTYEITTQYPISLGRIIRIQANSHPDGPADIGRWRLVRTPSPQGERPVVSIMRTADALQSDPDFAGLMIRCRENSGLQIGVVVIRPFPPRSHPQVSITDNHTTVHMAALVLPSGIILALPNEAEVLAKGSWKSLNQVSFTIDGNGVTIRGIVPLDNFGAALAYLRANCSEQ